MVNSIILQGRLVHDIELRYTASEVANCEFTVAWSEKYKEVEKKCFLRCKAWRNTAEFINKFFSKGQEIVIQGRMVTEEWMSEGEKKSRTICDIDKANFCGPKAPGSNVSAPSQVGDGFTNIPSDVDDEALPFN